MWVSPVHIRSLLFVAPLPKKDGGEQSLGRVLLPPEGITLGQEAGVAAQDILVASLGHTRKCWRRDSKTSVLLEAVLFLKHKSGASASELVTTLPWLLICPGPRKIGFQL